MAVPKSDNKDYIYAARQENGSVTNIHVQVYNCVTHPCTPFISMGLHMVLLLYAIIPGLAALTQ